MKLIHGQFPKMDSRVRKKLSLIAYCMMISELLSSYEKKWTASLQETSYGRWLAPKCPLLGRFH